MTLPLLPTTVIGSYSMPSWLERAKNAKRYEPRHFPYINLGRVYLSKGMIQQAIREFSGALEIHPADTELAELVQELQSKLQ